MSIILEIIKEKLYLFSDEQPPKNMARSYYFNIDDELAYESFNEDFGPINLGNTWKYVIELQKLLAHPDCQDKKIYHYTSVEPHKVANSVYLMGAFQVISLGKSAHEAFKRFANLQLKPFRDAGRDQCNYKCTVLDCLNGLQYAIKLGWFHYKTFNFPQYEHYEKTQNGCLNWVIPNKLIAFCTPSEKKFDKHRNKLFTPSDYVPIFKRLGVKTVVRLNYKTYQANDFVKKGIKHQELFFPDNTLPTLEIVNKFLEIAQAQKGALAVHCKAGLGRTGTLIACYALKHYYFPAAAFIGWIRIVRPGSIIGNHQEWLLEMQNHFRQQGVNSPIWSELRHHVGLKLLTKMKKRNERSLEDQSTKPNRRTDRDEDNNSPRLKHNKKSTQKSSRRMLNQSKSSANLSPRQRLVSFDTVESQEK